MMETVSASAFPAHSHSVQFYEDDRFLVETLVSFLRDGFADGRNALVVATALHRAALTAALTAAGLPLPAGPRLEMLDARTTLDRFMVDGKPDAQRFREVIGPVVSRLVTANGLPPCIFGEMVSLLWRDGNAKAAIQLEELWNDLAHTHAFSLLCAYDLQAFGDAAHAEAFARICATHAHVRPTESFLRQSGEAQLAEISRLQQRAHALEAEVRRRAESEAELADVLDNAAEAIHCVSGDGVIKWANARELAMLGYEADEYIGHHIAEFHVDRPTITAMLGRLARGETLIDYPARLRCKDGSVREVLVSSNALFRDGIFAHTRCFTRDVSELARANLELGQSLARERAARLDAERAREIAEQANRAKSQFLAVMSHELRTPLNAIGGYADLLEMGIHGPVTPEQRDAIERVQRSQRHLLGMINQVLNYARVETGNLKYEIAEVPMKDVLRSIESMMLPTFRTKGIEYECTTCTPEPVARADRDKVQQILLNLLANAVKFSENGARVQLSCSNGGPQVVVRVADGGTGIPSDKLTAIFEPFVQVDTNYTRTKDGIGLGLAISRDLARGMGGELTVESAIDAGSTFTLTLPAAGA
jgi:PAS domain S-box-containing protein